MDRTSITPTPHQMRALTHPVRLRMLGLLRVEGPATATSLAARLGLNSGATSYHLRQLATHGFVVDDETRGNGRERWWRAAHTYTHTASEPGADPEARDTEDAYLQSVATVYAEQLQRAVEERPLLPDDWRRASTFSDWQVRLTPARARELLGLVEAFVDDLVDEDGVDTVPYVFQLNAFPRPGYAATDRPGEPGAGAGDGAEDGAGAGPDEGGDA